MPHSDDFGIGDDDTEFIVAATQAEASHNDGSFEASPRPTKRRRVNRRSHQIDGASTDESASPEPDEGQQSPLERSRHFQSTTAPPQASAAEDEANEPETDDEYYAAGELRQEDPEAQKKSRYKIHIPKNGGQFPDIVFTQTQHDLDLSPSRLRGAVWKKPPPPPPPLPTTHATGTGNIGSPTHGRALGASSKWRQTTLSNVPQSNSFLGRTGGVEDDARLAARLQAEEDALARDQPSANKAIAVSRSMPPKEMHEELADLPSDAFASSSSPEKSPSAHIVEISSQLTASQPQPQPQLQRLKAPQAGLKQMTIFGQPTTQDLTASQATRKKHSWRVKSAKEPPTHHKLNEKAMETWVYPTNLGTIRDYQYNIVSRSLYHNTLVALPTGLGKTFIAAAVMLNYYRWTTDAQIIFMAPTKPLIAQQMEACYHIAGISRHATVLMTGETTPAVRAEEWLEKRVFFMTPQTVINDLKTGICDPKKIVLVVVDEAHKATGSYAYTEVVAFLRRFNTSFRVLALTATPGSSVDAVQAVINHLEISRVELRTEQSLDIRPYTHDKEMGKELFEYSDEQILIMEHISKAIRPQLEKLNTQNAYWSRDPMQLTAYGLTTARQKWAQSDAGRRAPMGVKGMVNAAFTVLAQIAHSIGLLKNHGIGPFYTGVLEFQRAVSSGQSKGKTAQAIAQHEEFGKMMNRIRGWTNNPDFIGHPKLQYLREVVLNHFLDAAEGAKGRDVPPSATRVMVFASYRDSTEEIVRVLKRNEPMIRPHVFVGQAASSSSEGMNQKRQNAVIQDFKSGKFNTLVATSIGEEGLDIGDVDLIVCYDASSSPVRMLQRIGRTGRKRVGRVVLLLMKGKEENDYAKAQDNYVYIQKSIADASKYTYREEQSPRILPREVHPVVDKRIIEIPVENSQAVNLNEKGRRAKGRGKAKRPPKKFHMPDGVHTGFMTASKLAASDEDADSEDPAPKNKASTRKRATAKAKRPLPSPDPEPCQLPFLQDVLLSDEQQRELERKYARIADDEDGIIRAPDPARFPNAMRELGPTKYVRHGSAANAVATAIGALQTIDDNRIDRMKDQFDRTLLEEPSQECPRPVSPGIEQHVSDDDPLAIGLPSDPLPAPKLKKSRGRPRGRTHKAVVEHPAHYGSAAMEGNESEPEPTPADMRIGTQGIDLGSEDTSGEDEDEELDSELDAFIAKSDEVIPTISSSLPATQQSSPPVRKGRGLIRKSVLNNSKGKRASSVMIDSISSSAESESPRQSDAAVTKAAQRGRVTKRVVADSDSD